MGAAEAAPLLKSHRRIAGHAGAFTLCKSDSLDKYYNPALAIRSVLRGRLVVPARGATHAKNAGGHPPFLRPKLPGAPGPRVQKAAGCLSSSNAVGGTGNCAMSHKKAASLLTKRKTAREETKRLKLTHFCVCIAQLQSRLPPAGETGFEPATSGFGDRRSTN